ncbi:MAG: hypothetical protein ACW97P_08315 [Candidatus Hodarchaeales archaeon]|jgi:hypothetical protein
MVLVDIELLIVILRQICFGSLISGLIIFFLTLFLQGGHLFGHDTDFDHDLDDGISLDHDVGDVDLDGSMDIDADGDISLDKDIHIGIDKEIDLHDQGFDADTPTPLMLLLGTFMISFGGTGVILLDSTLHLLITVTLIILIPIGATYSVSKAWTKLAVSEIYDTALETIKIDDKVKTLTTVDEEGGLVLIVTSSIHGPVKMAARTETGAIAKEMTAYVTKIETNTLVIDEWPSTEKGLKKIPEGSIEWD